MLVLIYFIPCAVTSAIDSGIAGSIVEYTDIDGVMELEKVPCVPNIPSPWLNGVPDKLAGGAQVFVHVSANLCTYCGEIIVIRDGQ